MQIRGRIASVKELPKGVDAEEKPKFVFALLLNIGDDHLTREEYYRLIQAKEKKETIFAEVELAPDQGQLNLDGGTVEGSEE